MPVTRAPRPAIASARMPPPQPTSITVLPARRARSSIQSRRSGLMSCSGRNSPCGSHQRWARSLNFCSSAGSAFTARFSQKKAPPKRGFSVAFDDYLFVVEPVSLEVDEEAPLALREAEPVLDVAPVAAGADGVLAVCSRLPRSSASTRRSGCRQAMSFWFLLLSLPSLEHSVPVTGSLSPLPATCSLLLSTPLVFR